MPIAFVAWPQAVTALHPLQGRALQGAQSPAKRQGLRHALAVCLLLSTAWGLVPKSALAQALPVVAQSALPTGAILQGIISYTAWPQRPQPLGLCISRSAPDAQDIARQVQALHDGRTLEISLIEANQPLPAYCHAVFLDGWNAESLRTVLRSLAHQAVLTLGRGPEFCSDGGMFCLDAVEGRTRFEVNLDAVARSGLRVHPQVLRLAKPTQRKV
ncbi:YfiR family protein [Paucibacter sp. Y2R2-4]|uniref:YfiR family protein n=1 Tax=Paucibacter sp. Y2R2-4 TaxID=2893553 RepID=UPI0021E439BE|nr:YfiR family protein [Paucibacter sp. Y2R2-4]MCV2352465.1 YfiR family protein [Paucibacter sp. Y2R2-4]